MFQAGMIYLLDAQAQVNWLVEQDNATFLALTQRLVQDFAVNGPDKGHLSQPRSILIAESDPIRFLAGFFAAYATHQQIFLGNPQWRAMEWQQAMAIAQPDHTWGNHAHLASSFIAYSSKTLPSIATTEPLIMLPTGGTSGQIRFVMHTWQTLAAAVDGFQQYFKVDAVNSLCVLPLYHVSGLMQVMRSLLSGGKLWLAPFQSLKSGQYPSVDPSEWFISLVPTQLQCLLAQPNVTQWLAQCRTVFIGGAPVWSDLLKQARDQTIPVSLCYGMTETAAQIVALRPDDFLSGKGAVDTPTVGQILPHAHITVVDEQNEAVLPGRVGQIKITSKSLGLGYYPTLWLKKSTGPIDWLTQPAETEFSTDDGGYFDAQGYLTLVGRLSDKIITGGENVFPTEVEAAIRATDLVSDIVVLGLPDVYWGQCVTAVYVPKDLARSPQVVEQQLKAQLNDRIARFKHPKTWISVQSLPRNAQGKLNRSVLKTLAHSALPMANVMDFE